jgi:hypothetical protein
MRNNLTPSQIKKLKDNGVEIKCFKKDDVDLVLDMSMNDADYKKWYDKEFGGK